MIVESRVNIRDLFCLLLTLVHNFGKVASHFCHPLKAGCQPVTEEKIGFF